MCDFPANFLDMGTMKYWEVIKKNELKLYILIDLERHPFHLSKKKLIVGLYTLYDFISEKKSPSKYLINIEIYLSEHREKK